jgi:5'-nucleotidase
MRKPPDLIVTGINIGPNVGDDVTYSGTVSSAMEGALRGIPSMAVSIATFQHPHFHTAAVVAARIAPLVVAQGLASRTFLNVNVPNLELHQIEGIEVTHQGKSNYRQSFSKRKDPRGNDYYWFTYHSPAGDPEPGSDFHALSRNRVSVTPLSMNFTCRKSLQKIKSWNLDPIISSP